MRRWVSSTTRSEGPASRSVSAIGQEWIVGEHGADAGEDSVGGVAKLLNFIACRGTGKPMRLIGQARRRRRSELAVGRERGFESDEGKCGANEVSECIVEVARLLLQHADARPLCLQLAAFQDRDR